MSRSVDKDLTDLENKKNVKRLYEERQTDGL